MIKNIDDLIKELNIHDIAEPHQLLGCSDQDIEQIEKRYGTLPNSYRQIMKLLGRRAGKLVNRYEFIFYIDQIFNLNEKVLETRKESVSEGEKILDLPEKMLFITSRYGDSIEFLLTNVGDDSPVYGYGFPCDGVEEVYSSVWEWIESFVEDAKNIIKLVEDSPHIERRYNY